MLYSTDRKRGVSLIFVNHQFFGNLLKKWIDKIRMYNKDGTRLKNKGVNLIVCLIFWTLKWFMYDTLTSPFTVSQISSRSKVNWSFSSYFELLWWLKCSVNCPEKSCIPFVFKSISLKCMLSEHSSERLRFLIRKGGKNADLIGKESLWIYTVYYNHPFALLKVNILFLSLTSTFVRNELYVMGFMKIRCSLLLKG